MEQQEYIELRPQPGYTLLSFGEYYQLNHDLSIARGWQLEQDTERYAPMNTPLAKVNSEFDSEGNETSYEVKLVMPISSDIQENHADLLTGVELVNSYIPVDDAIEEVAINDDIEPGVIDWTFNHCQAQGVDNSNLVTYIASQDSGNYPPIPNVGEWCEAKVYSYNGDKVKCLQPHTRMHFTPEETPALWLIIETVTQGYPEWKQPTGAHDAYNTGDRVTFQGNDYESLINANVWSPTVYPAGWKQI